MPAPVLNSGPLGDIPSDLVAELQRMARFLKAQATVQDQINYAALHDAQEYAEFQQATRALRVFPLQELLTREERLAFWINLYNVLAAHGIIALGVRTSLKERSGFFSRIAYEVGSYRFGLDDIEHGILRANRWKHPLLPRPFRRNDPRLAFGLEDREPRIHFALVCGARSGPSLEVYSAEAIEDQLDEAARNFIAAQTTFDFRACTVTTSPIFQWYRRDFGQSEPDVLRYLLIYLDDAEKRDFLRENLLRIKLLYHPYDWSLSHV